MAPLLQPPAAPSPDDASYLVARCRGRPSPPLQQSCDKDVQRRHDDSVLLSSGGVVKAFTAKAFGSDAAPPPLQQRWRDTPSLQWRSRASAGGVQAGGTGTRCMGKEMRMVTTTRRAATAARRDPLDGFGGPGWAPWAHIDSFFWINGGGRRQAPNRLRKWLITEATRQRRIGFSPLKIKNDRL